VNFFFGTSLPVIFIINFRTAQKHAVLLHLLQYHYVVVGRFEIG
jgi:hypothetical protein